MPVRSLSSAVFKWPDRAQVLEADRRWAARLRRKDPTVDQVLCIGSCARGDWGVGSDLDVIVIVRDTSLSPLERPARYEPTDVPVPVDLWVYTRAEWASLASQAPHFWKRLQREMLDLGKTGQGQLRRGTKGRRGNRRAECDQCESMKDEGGMRNDE